MTPRRAAGARRVSVSPGSWLPPASSSSLVVALYPLFQSFRLSFTNARFGSARPERYVGFDNYVRLCERSPSGSRYLAHRLFTVASVALETVFGMGVALIINSNFKGRGMVRTSMLIPWAIPTVVSSQLWKWMFNDHYGVINDLLVNRLATSSISKVAWLANPARPRCPRSSPSMSGRRRRSWRCCCSPAFRSFPVTSTRRPRSTAPKWQQFWQITLPLLRPALLVALIFRTLDAFRVFDVDLRDEGRRAGDDDGRHLRPADDDRSSSGSAGAPPPVSSSSSVSLSWSSSTPAWSR